MTVKQDPELLGWSLGALTAVIWFDFTRLFIKQYETNEMRNCMDNHWSIVSRHCRCDVSNRNSRMANEPVNL